MEQNQSSDSRWWNTSNNFRFIGNILLLCLILFTSSVLASPVFQSGDNQEKLTVQPVTAAPDKAPVEQKLVTSNVELQKQIAEFDTTITDLENTVNQMRRSITEPRSEDISLIDRKLVLIRQQLQQLDSPSTDPLTKIRFSDYENRLRIVDQSLESLKQRSPSMLDVFGLSFFKNAIVNEEVDTKSVPARYKLRPGDKITIYWFGSLGGQRIYEKVVGDDGKILVPAIGKVKVAGMALSEAKSIIATQVKSQFKQITIDISVEALSKIVVQISGEVARPGTYSLQGTATVLSALYKAGGTTQSATFRHINIIHSNNDKQEIDLYDFFFNGSKAQDYPLSDGDSIFVPTVGSTISIGGEVTRPGRYEPNFPLTLQQALKLAGGSKPSSYTQTVTVERVVNGEYQVLLNAPTQGSKGASTFLLQPGDQITVTPTREDKTNRISIEGPLNAPGLYGYHDGMRISDLISLARGLAQDKEVYGARADILRLDTYKGTQIITFNLEKALKGDESNDISLKKLDRVVLYEPEQVVFRPRVIMVAGAVAKPGSYNRRIGMKIADAIAGAGGVLPETYLQRAEISRKKADNSEELINVDLQAALNGDSEANLLLEDRDKLTVYSFDEVMWKDRTVTVQGSVQRPGEYPRKANMKLSDVLFAAGGLLPTASDAAEVVRVTQSGAVQTTPVRIDSSHGRVEPDPVLADRDCINIPSINTAVLRPGSIILMGQVNHPGPYALTSRHLRISDVIKKAGGITDTADTQGMLLLRKKDSFDDSQRVTEVGAILTKMKALSDKEFVSQFARMGISVPQNLVGSNDAAKSDPVQADVKTFNANDVQKTIEKQTLVEANGSSAESAVKSVRISLDFKKALSDPDSPHNLELMDGDCIVVPKISPVVTVVGAVMNPGTYVCEPGKNPRFYLQKAGGFMPDAAQRYTTVVHANCESFNMSNVKEVMPGDTIVVPTAKLVDSASKLQNANSVTKIISDIMSSIFVLTRL